MRLQLGSGKTAVLVERIIKKIIDDKIDIDKLLVVTFTNAAASEMRERVLDALYKKIEEDPENTNLHKQINLLNKANICTIDSFCLDIIKNYFYEIDVSANSRIADTTEINILKQEILEEIFEEKYMNNNKKFISLIETYTKYNKDEDLQALILKIYDYIQTNPFPEEWLHDKINIFKDVNKITNFSKTVWGNIIIEYVDSILQNCILNLTEILNKIKIFPEMEKYIDTINLDLEEYKLIKNNLSDWDKVCSIIYGLEKRNWPICKKIENELKDEAKEIRYNAKKEFEKVKELIPYKTEQIVKDMEFMYKILKDIEEIILEFSDKFYNKKREKNIIDFNDMEHLALKILVKKNADGTILPTEIAKMYQNKFEEIAIDEYQDSNLVQEIILNSVSRKNNIFMVGDVKQSIYKFRQARPELFLEKYDDYKIKPTHGENEKIQLFKNFRSRENILEFTNIVFKNIMSKELGNIDYNEEEYLNLGASFEKIDNQNLTTELNIINLKEEENIWEEQEGEEEKEKVENVVLEARYVAKKVKELIDSKYQVIDKKQGRRNIEFRDIAILLRSANTVAPIYEKELSEMGINVYSDSSESYLNSIEVETVISLLKVINNPIQDIALVTVLRSNIANFTDNELINISFENDKLAFYEKMIEYANENDNNLSKKIIKFLNKVDSWRILQQYKTIDELIWHIYIDTGYMDYVRLMPNGKLRVANLKLLFEKAKQYGDSSFKGLYSFINFIEKVKVSSKDTGAAKIIGENENVVRIMSIHKSKGLEFPVVILAGTGKRFNFQDLNEKLLMHQDLGFGPIYIDSNRHIEFKTVAKKAISIMCKNEIVSEEMRVLYVALTRAKEKLIITGIQKDVDKALSEKEKQISAYKGKINSFIVQKYKTYLDWLELVYAKEKSKSIVDLNIIDKNDILNSIKADEDEENILEKINKNAKKSKNLEEQEKIKAVLEWEYNNLKMREVPNKTSVTKIKELGNNKIKLGEKDTPLNDIVIDEKPKFLNKENKTLTGAEKGTLMHLCIQKLNEKQEYNEDNLRKLIEKLVIKDIITPLQAQNINVKKILDYTKSKLWEELKNAKEIYKEQPFYINISVDEIYDLKEPSKDDILVQGIIDLYYIDKNNKLVLVDFKTDFVNDEKELIEKYKEQLNLYKRALENSLQRKVDKMGIYSLYLNKFIKL